MKLLTFKQNNKHKLGIHTDQGIIDVEETTKNTNQTHIQTDIMDIIASTPADMKVMTDFVKQALNDHKRSEERRVGKECRSKCSRYLDKKKTTRSMESIQL